MRNTGSTFTSNDAGKFEEMDVSMLTYGRSQYLKNQQSQRLTILSVVEKLKDGQVFQLRSSYDLSRLQSFFGQNEIYQFNVGSNAFRGTKIVIGLNKLIKAEEVIGEMLGEDPKLLLQIAEDSSKFYERFKLKKKGGGHREINAPNEDLKRVQEKILKKILYAAGRHTPYAMGFVKRRSIKTNAEKHLRCSVLVKMDLHKFFDTVNEEMVKSAFVLMLKPLNLIPCCDLLTKLCTLNGATPQGAPTSPALTNAICRELDLCLNGLASRHRAVYTRYADDITMSSKLNTNLNEVIPIIDRIVQQFGFTVNRKKTGVFRKGGRMPVTGIVVNEKLNVSRKKRLNFRAKLHNIITGKTPLEDAKAHFEEIQGFANFINMVNPQQGERFLGQIATIKQMIAESDK